MARVICQNCGSEVILPEHSHLAMGMTISKETKGDYVLPMRDSKGRFVSNKSTEEKENETMMNNNNNATVNANGGMNMNNGFDMEMLTKLVAQAVQSQLGNVNNNSQNTTENVENSEFKSVAQNYMDVVDGGKWAKGSKYYGKEICGFVFNPYMFPWHVVRQFKELMDLSKKDDYNVHGLIAKNYPYMYSINFTMEMVRKLAMLNKKDRIAYDEVRRTFDLESCKRIFADYIKNIIKDLETEERILARTNKIGKEVYISRKKYGTVKAGVVIETIENHRVVKTIKRTLEFETVYADLNRILNQLTRKYAIYSYKDLYELMNGNTKIKVDAKTRKSRYFMNCFIKRGAYYTLKADIAFNNAVFRDMTGRKAIDELRRELNRENIDGYQFYAMLKESKGIRCSTYRY